VKIIPLAIATVMSAGIAIADDWGLPSETDYLSESRRFVAHVTPRKDVGEAPPMLEVFEITDGERVPRWWCTLGNEHAPVEVFVSDDGQHLVTMNEHGGLGFGDYVVAFYNGSGIEEHYTLEDVFHVPQEMSPSELDRLISRSVSSRWWDTNSIKFFDAQGGRLHFCIWVCLLDRWVAWDVTTGREVTIDSAMSRRLNDEARRWSLSQIQEGKGGNAPWLFLTKRKNPEDRPVIEALLSDAVFEGRPSFRSVSPPLPGKEVASRLDRFEAVSGRRAWGELLLAVWDQKDTSGYPPLHHLGRVEGVITLPRTSDPNRATLWVYLIPDGIGEDHWHESLPVQRLAAAFSDLRYPGLDLGYAEEFPFTISTVTPGRYWIKAVLDKTEPLSKAADAIYVPGPGDYESVDSPIVNVVAGKTENGSIDCTQRIADGID
jgi:hypothetical protein